jgi:hypothetical protein
VRPSPRITLPLVLLALTLPSLVVPAASGPNEGLEAAPNSAAAGSAGSAGAPHVLRLSGSPYDIGYQHGVALGQEIRERLQQKIFGGMVIGKGVSHALLLRHAREVESLLPADYKEEMRGLADGAGISYSQAVLLNVSVDLVSQPWPEASIRELMLSLSPRFVPPYTLAQVPGDGSQSTALASSDEAGEIIFQGAFAAFGTATRDGGLLHAAWFESCPAAEDLVVVVYHPISGNGFVAIGRPGMVGFTAGVNEEGLSVTGLDSPSRDATLEGIPLPILLREVLQYAGDIPTALGILGGAQRTTGRNVLIGDGKRPDAQVMEFSAHLVAVFPAENDLVTRSGHYLDGGLAETQRALDSWDEDSSWQHLEDLLQALEPSYGRLDAPLVGRLISGLVEAEQTSARSDNVVCGIVLDGRERRIQLVLGVDGELTPGVGLDDQPKPVPASTRGQPR